MNLGVAHQRGLGVHKNLVIVHTWFAQAAARRLSAAAVRLAALEAFMKREEIASAHEQEAWLDELR